jgi:hypothetical protein
MVYKALENMIRVVHPGSRIRMLTSTHPGSRGQKGIGSRIRIRNTGCDWSFLCGRRGGEGSEPRPGDGGRTRPAQDVHCQVVNFSHIQARWN